MGIKFSNLASTTLASGVSSSTTSISVTSATSFPTLGSGDYFYASIGIGSASEVVKVTSISGTTFTAVRGQDSTTAISHSSGAEIALRVVAATLEDLRDATDNDTTYSAGTGVSLSGTTFSLTDTNSKLNLSGGTLTGNLNLGDNDKAVFGASDDLQIYHDGSNSFITDTGTGNLYVRASNELALTSAAGEAFFLGIADGSSYLYHNGSVKLNTTATGIDVTGSVTATGGNSGNWNTAYGWGNHASAGYLTSHQSLSGYATETYVGTQVSNLVDSSPSTLNTLNELAAALGDDPNFATTVSTSIGTKLPLAGGTLTGGLSGTTGSFSGSVTADKLSSQKLTSGNGGLRIHSSGTKIFAITEANAVNSGAMDLGASDAKFKDLHLSGTISSGAITSTELTITGGSGGADLYINNTSPTLGFTDSNSFSDASDIYIVRAGSTGDLQFQFFDDSANTTTTTFQIDETGNTTIAGTISSGAITAPSIRSSSGEFHVNRSSDGASAIRVDADGVVVIPSNYFYVPASQGSYFSSAVRFRGMISNDTGTDVTIGDTLNVTLGIKLNGTTVIDASRNLTNVNLVKFRESGGSFYISPTNANTLNAQHGSNADTADMWINYRGYNDTFSNFRDFRIGDGKGSCLLFVDGSSKAFDFQSGSFLQISGTTVIDASRNLTNIGSITCGGINSTAATVLNSHSASDPDATSRSNYPAGQMLTHYSEANGVSIIGGQGGYAGSSLTIGEETGRSTAFKLIRGISDTNGTPAEEFSINGVGDAVFAGSVRAASGNYYGGSGVSVQYRGFGDKPIMTGVSGATYLYAGNSTTVALTLQSGRTVAPTLAIGSVNNFTDVIDASRNITAVNITPSGYISQATGQSHYFRGGTDGNWRIGSDITADTGGLITGPAIQLITGGSSTSYGFQIFGHQTPTLPVFEVIPNTTLASSITNVRGNFYINNTQVIDSSRNALFASTLQIGGSAIGAGNSYNVAGYKLLFGGGNSDSTSNYYIGTNLENVGGNYSKLDLRWHTGIRMGAQGVYGGIRFYNDEDLTSKLMSIGEGSSVTDVKVYNDLRVEGALYHSEWVRNHTNNSGHYWSQTGWHLYPKDVDDFYWRSGNSSSSALAMTCNSETVRGYFYVNSSSQIGMLNSGRGWSFKVDNSGNATATGNVTAYSDRRLKSDIEPLENSLNTVCQLQGIRYTRISTGVTEIGFVAQDVKKVVPELVDIVDSRTESSKGFSDGFEDLHVMKYQNTVALLVEAIKELKSEVDDLKNQLSQKEK